MLNLFNCFINSNVTQQPHTKHSETDKGSLSSIDADVAYCALVSILAVGMDKKRDE